MDIRMMRDKTKKDEYMCLTLQGVFRRGEIRKNHPLQRKADKWKNDTRDGFIATVIKQEDVDSIKICEQIVDGNVVLWLIDGLQRLSNLEKYKNGLFKIGNSVEMPIVCYQETKVDDDGEIIFDDLGDPVKEWVEFDLRGKYYKDLPGKLKENFDNYPIAVVKHLDCADDEIGYHIRRYNRQTSMNNNETSITYMNASAKNIKAISQEHSFFKNCGVYTASERKNGVLDRIVCEALMAVYHLDDWKKNSKKMGSYINDNISQNEFNEFANLLTRLENIVQDKYQKFFNSKNSFVMFAAFDRFSKLGVTDNRFADFLDELENNLNNKVVEEFGMSYNDINENRATKDKSVIMKKLGILESLMRDYFDVKDENEVDFVKTNVSEDITENDVKFYVDLLDDLTLEVDNNSKLLEMNNRKSLLAIVAYATLKDEDLDKWFPDFFERHDDYNLNQVENYNYMKNDFQRFLITTKGAA